MKRPDRILPLALLPLLLLACGDGADVPRIQVSTFDLDGAPPSDLMLVPLDPSRSPTPLRAVGGGFYEAPGAPDGGFQVEGAGGWSTLNLGPVPPDLGGGGPPPKVRLAPPNTVYVFCPDLTYQPGLRWGARKADAGGTDALLPVQVHLVSNRRVALLRFRPEDWNGRLEVLGHLVRGGTDRIRPEDVGKGPLAEILTFEAPADGHSLIVQARPAASAPIQIGLVPAGPDVEVDGIEVAIRLLDVPLALSWTRASKAGIVRLARLPLLGRDLAARIQGTDASFPVGLDALRDQETVYLLALPRAGWRDVRVAWPGGDRPRTILARPASAPAYGLAPVVGDAVRLPSEATTLLAERDGGWTLLEVPEGATGAGPAPAYEAGVVIQGRVEGLPPSGFAAVRLFRREGKVRATGTGFTRRLAPNGVFSFRVPLGSYEAEVATSRGVWRRPRAIQATESGGQHHITLRAP